MLFNSIPFIVFLPIVFVLHWVLPRKMVFQNSVLLVASYVFYGCWDWRFLSLIALSTVVDFFCARWIHDATDPVRRRVWLGLTVGFNLGLLGFFKYWNFFADSWATLWGGMGVEVSAFTLQVTLPVGISFYTFQTLSYSVDVYRGRIQPTTSLLRFATFVSFFPQLVAGPIERAARLLPQMSRPREFNQKLALDGLRLMLWGGFKKVVVADRCAIHVDAIFGNYGNESGMTLVLGVFLFAFQIYCDFSGYSDIARGVARLFGVELMVNFRNPYFSRDLGEFWRRWHISLNTWFRDYVYIPLGGSKGGPGIVIRNVLIVFLLSGLWHGANWTFVVWGILNAVFFLPLILGGKPRRWTGGIAEARLLPTLGETMRVVGTFVVVCLGWVFFRSESLSAAFGYLGVILSPSSFFSGGLEHRSPIPLIVILMIVEYLYREREVVLPTKNLAVRFATDVVLCLALVYLGQYIHPNEFIYFQF